MKCGVIYAEIYAGNILYDSSRTRCGIFMRSTRRIQIPQHFFFAGFASFCSKFLVLFAMIETGN
jgi:hypothetical protein